MMGVPKPFPNIKDIYYASNPAFILYGSRFFADQTVLELLAEFLSVAFSDKWISLEGPIKSPLPSLQELHNWESAKDQKLEYKPPIRLNLKLFSLLCASPLDSRHEAHENQYRLLMENFTDSVSSNTEKPEEIRDWIEDLLMGFQGAGFDRTWCAQTFYPVSSSFLIQETIWKHSYAQNKRLDWNEIITDFNKFFRTRQHTFFARGGELLYLQLCNLFANQDRDIKTLAEQIDCSPQESRYDCLHDSLTKGLQRLKTEQIDALNKLADFIENLDQKTNKIINQEEKFKQDKLTCGWCPEESWQESYLFAVEITRILNASIDPIQRLELLQIGCVLQVMRSLCAQSLRFSDILPHQGKGGLLGYAWIITPLNGYSRQQRLASCHNLQTIFRLLQRALNNEDIVKIVENNRGNKQLSSLMREAENKYGHKYFNLLGKRIGIIYPWRGAEPRFILADKLLSYLVLSVIPPGKSCTYPDFKERIYMHYGIAVEGEQLRDAVQWSGLPVNSSVQPDKGSWLTEMLRASGFFIELSDGCSIVHNPFSSQV